MVSERKNRPESSDTTNLLRSEVTPQELEDVLADQGYSADGRKGRLKEILTELVQNEAHSPNEQRASMIEKVKEIIDEHQQEQPIAKDVLGYGRR